MAIIHVDESTLGLPNSGRLSGTNGDLVGIMDVALPLNGWAIEYSAGNARVYRPGSGNRFRLHMNDDSAVSGSACFCVVRGCENASSATVLVDPFPTIAQVADTLANWNKSSIVSTTARLFDIWVGETFIIYAVNWSGSTNLWELHFFGDFAPSLSGDSYNTLCTSRNTATPGGNEVWANSSGWINSTQNGSDNIFICRSYDGSVKSTLGGVNGRGGQTAIGLIGASVPVAGLGLTSGIDTQIFSIYDSGVQSGTVSSSLALPIRGFLPNILSPQHGGPGSFNTRYNYAQTPYMASGKVVRGNTGWAVVQESDDWVPPVPV
jgi:hypothetical protein